MSYAVLPASHKSHLPSGSDSPQSDQRRIDRSLGGEIDNAVEHPIVVAFGIENPLADFPLPRADGFERGVNRLPRPRRQVDGRMLAPEGFHFRRQPLRGPLLLRLINGGGGLF